MKKILVPTDFSPNAEKALNYAIHLAKRNNAEIILIHAVEVEMMRDDLTDERVRIAQMTRSIKESENIPVTSKVIRAFPVDAILEAIREFKTDWVVMGTLGNSALSEKLWGSRTAGLIGKSPVPVLAIPLMGDWKIPEKFMLAIKESDNMEEPVRSVMTLARQFNASVQIAIFTDTDDDYVEDYQVHETRIAVFRDQLQKQYPDVEIHAVHLAGHHFTENVNHWISERGIDIMVMLTRHRNFFEKLFSRSMTKKMSYRIDIPLLAIPV